MKDGFTYNLGLKVRCYPSTAQKQIIAINDGIRRKAFNAMLDMNTEFYHLNQINIHMQPVQDRIDYLKFTLSSVTTFKNRYQFMNDKNVDSSAVLNAIQNYKAAWNLYKKNPAAGIPEHKKKDNIQHYQTNNHYNSKKGLSGLNNGSARFIDKTHFQMPVLGVMRISGSKSRINMLFDMQKHIRLATITVEKDATGRYYLALALSSDIPFMKSLPKTGAAVGIDVNLSNLLTDSDGNVIANPKYRKNVKKKLCKAQRKLSLRAERAKKESRLLSESKNYQKQRKVVSELQRKSAARMNDYLNVVSKNIINSHDYIFTEDLKVKNLLKNHKLAYAISDVSWSELYRQLKYKAELYGRTFLQVHAQNTTQTCRYCGYVCNGDTHIGLGVEEWVCPQCGKTIKRDYNAACNILERGLKELCLV